MPNAVGDGGTLLRLQDGRWVAMPSRVSVTLRGVCAAPPGGADEFYAVGDGGTLLRGGGGGVTAVASGTGRDLYAVSCGAEERWAVGAGGTILRLADGAVRQEPGTEGLARGATLRAVWADGGGDVWVAGDGGLLLRRSKGAWAAELSGAREDLHRLFGTGPADVWAAGGNELPPGRDSALLHFDGQRWTRVGTGTGRLALFGLHGTGRPGHPGRVWAVGESGGILRLRGY